MQHILTHPLQNEYYQSCLSWPGIDELSSNFLMSDLFKCYQLP